MKTKQDSSPLKVGLVQINNSFSGLSYMPYSVGLMQAYAASHVKNPDDFIYLIPVFSRMKVVEAVRHLLPADIVAFSVYVWDEQLSLAIARELKKAKPEIITLHAYNKSYECKFFFTDTLPRHTPIILGQLGFFDHFRITFDYRENQIELL